jgi:predicted RecA/RadA family phage recombinase
MSTTAQNTQVYADADILYYPVDTTGSNDINQGDYVYWDSSAHQVKSIATNGNAATAAGVAASTSYKNLYGTKNYQPGGIQVYTRGIFQFKSTASDTINHGDSLYIGADAQTLTNTDPGSGNVIAFAWLRLGGTAITGAAGTNFEALLKVLSPFLGV